MENVNTIIFGDSYSTHESIIPKGYITYYSDSGRAEGPAVTSLKMQDTWWYRYISHVGGKLLRNDSWSGSTICYTGYNHEDCSRSSSFIYRYRQLKQSGFFEKNRVDRVLVFGGTNDSWSDAPLGELKTCDWQEQDLFCVLPAISYFAYTLKTDLPDAEIVFIINTDIKEEIRSCMEEVARCFGLRSVRLEGISKEYGHPTATGMREISEQLIRATTLP